ncbi:MAG: hypothetical protein KAT58_10445 [candidate division Zixibacteria bacterium]|nr:hypothetical protein [candidate division Zixibacteria bacterium]
MKKILILLLLMAAVALLTGCDERTVYVCDAIPDPPVGIYSITHDGCIEVVWQANNDAGLTESYGVYRFTGYVGNLEEYELIGTVGVVSGAVTEHFDDYNVINGETYWYAVNAYNGFGESDLSYESAFDTPRPQGNASLRDYLTYPAQAGFDFSSHHKVVNWESAAADIFFEYDANLDAFFFYAADWDVDIQDFGYTDNITDVNWGDPGSGWSAVGWIQLSLNHAYLVWTADDHYAAFRVNSLNPGSKRVDVTWAYQTDPGNPELAPRRHDGPQRAENYGRREN